MALITCTECSKEISTLAPACPQCGAPAPPAVALPTPPTKETPSLFTQRNVKITVFIIVALWFLIRDKGTERKLAEREAREAAQQKADEPERLRKKAECRKSLDCWGQEHMVLAIIKCQDPIEKLAKYQFEWTDGWTEPKLHHSQWLNVEKGIVRYTGDKIKLQNGFGARTGCVYECDYDTLTDTALAVRVQPGRLP